MSQVINTNVLSLTAQRNLQTSQSQLATSLQRLSSGLRINSAKDDAAGLAISERFTTQIRGLNQAIRNSNDGISLAQTGEAALATVTENLQRIRELAVQSVNATNSDTDRATLQQEVEQRLNEIDRIASQTSFNGRNVLDGSFGNALFQVGANVGETIELTLNSSVRTSDVGEVATATSSNLDNLIAAEVTAVPSSTGALGAFDEAALATTDTANFVFSLSATGATGITATAAVTNGASLDAAAVAGAIDTAFSTATDGETVDGFTIDFGGASDLETAITDGSLSFSRADGVEITATQAVTTADFGDTAGFGNIAAVTVATDSESITTTNGTEAVAAKTLTVADDGLTFQFGDGSVLEVAADVYTTVDDLVGAINTALGSNGTASLRDGVVTISSGEQINIVQTGITDQDSAAATIFAQNTYGVSGDLSETKVDTVDNANIAITRIDAALTTVSDLRSTFGAIQNRFESTIANLSTTTENLQASRSRILDADFAAETANLTRVQILQQAGISVLSQANVQPQNVLALLQ